VGRLFSNPWVITIVGGVIAAVVSAFLIADLLHTSSTGSAQAPAPAPAVTSNAPSTPAPAANPFTAGSTQLPEQLIGTWQGTVLQANDSTQYPVVLQLARSAGTVVGTSSYATLDCQGQLELDAVYTDSVEVTEYITSGQGSCTSGVQITLKYLNKDQLFYSFAYSGDPVDGQATLTRS